jgi:hypothetical protein
VLKKNVKRILICDFSASLNYTHHLQFIKSNIMFMSRNYSNVVIGIILPIGSEISHNVLTPANFTRKLLWPIFLFPHTKKRISFTWITFFWRKLGEQICKISPRLYLYLSLVLVIPFFIFCRANLIVFPSVCAQSLKLIEILEFFHVRKSFHIHFTNTSEVRIPYGTIQDCENFIRKSNGFEFVNIISSFESQTLLDLYSDFNTKKNFYLALPPSTHDLPCFSLKSSRLDDSDVIKVLVMGRTTTLDRDNLISRSLIEFQNKIKNVNMLKSRSYEFSITVDDASIIELVTKSNVNSFVVKRLSNQMSYLSLINLLNTATVIVLPYTPSVYARNHSGMVLISSDLQIPIVTCEQAVFSQEIIEFKLGNLFNHKISFADALIKTLINLNTFESRKYYDYREQQNRKLYEKLNFHHNFK